MKTKKIKIESVEEVAKKVIAKETKAPKKGSFVVVIETNGEKYETITDDISSAIMAVKAPLYKTQTVIRVTYGDKTVVRQMFTAFARRLFNNPMTAFIFEKGIRQALNAPAK